jgi:hypothetical protein
LRRKMSALTTTILGAVVAASTVSAQQLPPRNQSPQSNSAASATAPESEPEQPDPLFGMTAMRGARYLLRNGLDYLNYQEYERALKFLREAEKRDQETELANKQRPGPRGSAASGGALNKTEKLALKQGIERAQRGLRDAADAETPYALSDRSRRRNGFIAAKPDNQVASNTSNAPATAARKPGRPDQPTRLGNDSEDQGEPIRLASAELVSSSPVAQSKANPSSTNTKNTVANDRPDPSGPAGLPDAPLLSAAPQSSDLADRNANASPASSLGAGNQGLAVAGRVTPPQRSTPPPVEIQALAQAPQSQPVVAPAVANPVDQITSLPPLDPAVDSPAQSPGQAANVAPDRAVGAPVSVAASSGQPLPLTVADSESNVPAVITSQKPVQAAESSPIIQTAAEPSSVPAKDPVPQSPAPMGDAPALALEATPPSLAPAESTPASAPAAAAPSPAPAAATQSPTPVEATPAPAPVENKTVSPAPVMTPPSSGGLVQSSGSKTEAGPTPASPAVIDLERIPLPPLANTSGQPDNSGDLAHKEAESTTLTSMPSPAKDAAPVQTAAPAAPAAMSVDINDLPPLPRDLGNTDSPVSAPVAAPAQAGSSIPLATIPATVNQPTGHPAEPAAPHTEDESPAPLPSVNPAGSAPTTAAALPEAGAAAPPSQAAPVPANAASPEPGAAPTPADTATNLELPQLPDASAAAPAPAPVQTPAPASQPPASNPNLEREPETVGLETGVGTAPGSAPASSAGSSKKLDGTGFDPFLPSRSTPASTLRPELQRQVEEIARRQEDELNRQIQNPPQTTPLPRDSGASDLRAQTQLDISRAPSPAEARPIKAIPVPEDWVPLAQRDWTPQRKYWAAAATCHLPLYFQDPVLERYGHSVEQFVGPVGRFLTYPVDDPTQSTQRNQILQPFASIGLFSLQVLAWPYNLIVDPPWEAQYDLGYYRPGDNIPTDTYWLPLHGYGPPLHGSSY